MAKNRVPPTVSPTDNPYLPASVGVAQSYLNGIYATPAYKDRLQNEVLQSQKMREGMYNQYPQDVGVTTSALLADRADNINKAVVLPSISTGDNDAARDFTVNKMELSAYGYMQPNVKFNDELKSSVINVGGKLPVESTQPTVVMNPYLYGQKYEGNPVSQLGTAIEEVEHASHVAVPGSPSNNMMKSPHGDNKWFELGNVTPYAQSVIQENTVPDDYYSMPTEVIAKKRVIENMLGNAPAGTFDNPYSYGQKMTDKHFDYMLEKAKASPMEDVEAQPRHMMKAILGKDADPTKLSDDDKEKAKVRFKNIMDKLAVKDVTTSNPYS